METSLKTLFLFILASSLAFASVAQTDPEEYIRMATSELDISCQTGLIHEYVLESGTKGTYTFEITIKGKGQIVSMNIKERSEDGKVKLSFKIPKERYYKFDYTFSFK
jgi:hypothetical protein